MGDACGNCGQEHADATEYTSRSAAFEMEQLSLRLGEDTRMWLGAAHVMVAIAYEERVSIDASNNILGVDGIDEAEAAKQGALVFSAILGRFSELFADHPVGTVVYAKAISALLRRAGVDEEFTERFDQITGQS